MPETRSSFQTEIPKALSRLREDKVRNAWAIQDLTIWPQRSKITFAETSSSFAYLLISGHPASHEHPTLIADGDAQLVSKMLDEFAPNGPFVIRETSAHLIEVFKGKYPQARVFLEQRMDVTKTSFIPKHRGLSRDLTGKDAEALAAFFGAPPQAASRFMGWLKGSRAFFGVFEGERIAAIGSTMVSIPEAWTLVSIQTHKDYRCKGYATEVTSALVERALQETDTVCVTVVKDNLAAIRTYEKVGFKPKEERVWIDNGTGSAP